MSSGTKAGIAVAAPTRVQPTVPHAYWTLDRVARALHASVHPNVHAGARDASPLAGISTDTRTIVQGDLFVALVGVNFDGHDFLAAAREAGAAACVVSHAAAATGLGLPVFVVPDTLIALGQLATAWRRAWGRTVIAVAGSNGKTSTKELIKAALGTTHDVHATLGNLNNLIGVPLTVLAIPPHASIAVVEIGTNTPGEVARLRAMTEPNIAVLTSIGEEHLEGLGDLAGVLREETSVFDDVDLAIVPSAHPEVVGIARARARAVVTAGLVDAQVAPTAWGMDDVGRPWIACDGARVLLPLRGAHQAANAMLAFAAARACGVSASDAAVGMAAMPVPSMRGVWTELGHATLINDAYNANPASMRAALQLLDGVGSTRQRVAILGSMRELGAHSSVQHAAIAQAALASSADLIVGVGEFASAFATLGADQRVLAVDEVDAVWPRLAPRLARDAVILLKASRGMRLERLIPFLTAWSTT